MSLSSPVLIETSESDTDPIEDSSDIKEDAILIESSESCNTLSDEEINDDDHVNVTTVPVLFIILIVNLLCQDPNLVWHSQTLAGRWRVWRHQYIKSVLLEFKEC